MCVADALENYTNKKTGAAPLLEFVRSRVFRCWCFQMAASGGFKGGSLGLFEPRTHLTVGESKGISRM